MNKETYELAEKIVSDAGARGVSLALAESCTGGMIAAAITAVAGSSGVFLGSAVTYGNKAKEDILGVQRDIIMKFGAVSRECAVQMARGALRIFSADLALSVTGIAGPGGGSAEKPVGTVWFGFCSAEKEDAFVCSFKGTREDIRIKSVSTAMKYLIKELR